MVGIPTVLIVGRTLRGELDKVREADINEHGWVDVYESWQAVFGLRSKLDSSCAQQILTAIVSDETVLSGLCAAHTFRNARFTGKPPQTLLLQLKQGPGKHMKAHAYEYTSKLDNELSRISRVQTLQQRFIALVGSTIVSIMIVIAQYVSQTIFLAANSNVAEARGGSATG